MKIRRLVLGLSLALFFAAAAPCRAAEATLASIEQLLVVTKSESALESMYTYLEQLMGSNMQQATQGKPLSDEQRRLLEAQAHQFGIVMRQEMSWANLKDLYVQIYRETFSEEEIQGLVAFYVSPVGQAFVDKMPQVMQRTMAIMQQRMQPLMPKMKDAMEKALQEAKVPR